jgi:hypothetical protein
VFIQLSSPLYSELLVIHRTKEKNRRWYWSWGQPRVPKYPHGEEMSHPLCIFTHQQLWLAMCSERICNLRFQLLNLSDVLIVCTPVLARMLTREIVAFEGF